LANFDLETTVVPSGLSVIEASAGTGKTWTIAHLVPRLLLDGVVSEVGELLLVTFTEDAARELGARTRRQLAMLVEQIDAGSTPPPDENGVGILLERFNRLPDPDRDAAHLRLQLALDESDQLAVSTIHAFCQRVLIAESFLCGTPAGLELLPDVRQIQLDAVEDTWRTELATDPMLTGAAVVGREWSVKKDFEAWDLLTRHPNSRMVPVPLSLSDARNQVTEVLAVLRDARDDLASLEDIAARPGIKLNESGTTNVPQLGTWRRWLQRLDSRRPSTTIFHLAAQLEQVGGWFNRRSNAGKAAEADANGLALVQAAGGVGEVLQRLRWAWLGHLHRSAKSRFEEHLRRHNAITYEGLIHHLHRALCEGANGPSLARRLSEQWKVGLIDESQDTDQRQLEIFRAIFDRDSSRERLILVGDPKQSIYGFRGGDLEAYLAARPAEESRISTLAVTYRSAPGLVRALNRLFERPGSLGSPALDYTPATAARQDADLPLPEDGQARLVAWVVPDTTVAPWGHSNPRQAQAAACTATAIVALLNGGGENAEAIYPSQIAVLTRTNKEARVVHEALRTRGVPAVVRDDADVMRSETASDLATFLRAVLFPTHPGWRRAAMATRLFGYDATRLAALTDPEADARLASFSEWNDVWRERGITALMATLESQSESAVRLAQHPDGERYLTDLRHLVELLQAHEAEGTRSPETLLHWFEGAGNSEEHSADERLRRLERDGAAVQVVTVYRAKGLEFDFVYCPYLWSVRDEKESPPYLLVREQDGWILSDRTRSGAGATKRASDAERVREELRLAYVALTRARRRVTLLAGALGYSSGRKLPPTALDWLLRPEGGADTIEEWYESTADAKRNPSACPHEVTLGRFRDADPDLITVLAPPTPTRAKWREPGDVTDPMRARPTPSVDMRGWHLTSFSQLAHGRHEERERHDTGMESQTEPVHSGEGHTVDPGELESTPVPLATFARGPQAGNCLHEILERWNFTENPVALIDRSLKRHRLHSEQAVFSIQRALDALRTTRLTALGTTVASAAVDPSLSEWEFLLPLGRGGISGLALSEIFARHARNDAEADYALELAGLPRQTLAGMLTGYIDRLVHWSDRWAVIDWKSNYLGSGFQDYDHHALWRCAARQHYVLQIHLYLVALRRYLGLYDSGTTRVSGSLFFLRGVAPDRRCGVLDFEPTAALLDDLEGLFVSTRDGAPS
jgi:exodeoxyribonuclease V beta subunit